MAELNLTVDETSMFWVPLTNGIDTGVIQVQARPGPVRFQPSPGYVFSEQSWTNSVHLSRNTKNCWKTDFSKRPMRWKAKLSVSSNRIILCQLEPQFWKNWLSLSQVWRRRFCNTLCFPSLQVCQRDQANGSDAGRIGAGCKIISEHWLNPCRAFAVGHRSSLSFRLQNVMCNEEESFDFPSLNKPFSIPPLKWLKGKKSRQCPVIGRF